METKEKSAFYLAALGGVIILILSIIIATTLLPASTPNRIPTNLNETFEISIGQDAAVSGESLRIKLLNVSGDSRCPSDVECVWAGQVTVTLEVSTDNPESHGTLNLTHSVIKTAKDFGIYSIGVLKVSPWPASYRGPIKQSDYVVTLSVNK